MGRTPTTRSSRQTKISGEINTGYGGGYEDGEAQDIEEEKSARIDIDWEGGDRSNRNKAPEKSPISRPGGIDLNKSADLDLEKPKPPKSGGFGIDIGKSPKNNTNVGLDIPVPSVPGLSARGGVSIDPKTGKIRGGYGGAGFGKGPISGSLDAGLDDGGCYHYVTLSIGPFSHTWGENKCKEKEKQTSSAPSTPTSGQGSPEDQSWNAEGPLPNFRSGCRYKVWFLIERNEHLYQNCTGYSSFGGCTGYQFTSFSFNSQPGKLFLKAPTKVWWSSTNEWLYYMNIGGILGALYVCGPRSGGLACTQGADFSQNAPGGFPGVIGIGQDAHIQVPESYGTTFYDNVLGSQVSSLISERVSFYKSFGSYTNIRIFIVEYTCTPPLIPRNELLPDYGSGGTSTPTKSPPIPNYPPTKKKMDEDCCRIIGAYLELLVVHHGALKPATSEQLPEGTKQLGQTTEQGLDAAFPFEIKKQWIDPTAKDNDKVTVSNFRELTFVLGGMINRLEKVLGTAEFYKDSDKKLRQSEGNLISWLVGKNPDFKYPDPNDFWFNTDDGVINEKTLEVKSIADAIRYQVEALNRLERILPIAELKDSSIPARWIHPGGKGQLRVGNLIHLCEYMIRKDDRDRGYWPQKITIKEKDPNIEGDEGIYYEYHSQADMLKAIFDMLIDTEADGDTGTNYDLRRTYLDIMAFQMIAKNNKYLQAITEYLNFDLTEQVETVPIPFDPFAGQQRSIIEEFWNKFGFGKPNIEIPQNANTEEEIERLSDGLLQNSELQIGVVKFGSPDEGKEPKTLKEALIEILKHSSASSAAVSERVSEGALKRVVDAASLAQKLTSFLMRRDIRESLGIGDLDKWSESAERGYTDNLESEALRFPESDPLKPYGRPSSENPLIREIDSKDPKAD